MTKVIAPNWWRDPRCHFGKLTKDSPLLTQRQDLQPTIEFIVTELALPAGARILDLCCGPGRYCIELAHRGFAVVGIDLNERYVALASQVAEQDGVRAQFLAGDMREIPFVDHFDAVINVGTSFGFFADQADDQRAIHAVARALKPGGTFLLEMANRDYYLKNFQRKDWRTLKDSSVITVRREFDYTRSRMNVTFERFGKGQVKEQWAHSWRAYTLAEIVAVLERSGLVLSRVFGNWQRAEYSVDSSRMVVISKKRAAVSA